ncbi:mechanosensitive ion channel family protein [Candidatus Woesearchaeota archaeon]|nr:MAG: mechanosensitive ion channel family protein [Candidatus Woesearchaeota archaeon]
MITGYATLTEALANAVQNTNTFLQTHPGKFILITLISAFTILTAKLFRQIFEHAFTPAKHPHIDKTRYTILKRLLVALIYIIGFGTALYIIPGFRTIAEKILLGAAVLAGILGFAAKDAFTNLIGGVFIAIFEPFRVGDVVTVDGDYGTVEDITLRHTVIRTWENQRVIIPNSKITESKIINYTIHDEKILMHIDFTVSYDADLDLAKRAMKEEALKHPLVLNVAQETMGLPKDEHVAVRVLSCDDYGVRLRLFAWAKDQPTAFRLKCDLTEAIKKRFDKEGIEIPYPYRTIIYKKDINAKKKKRSGR